MEEARLVPGASGGMSAIPTLSGDKQTSGERAKNDASDPNVWSGRALQEVFVDPVATVLHQCVGLCLEHIVLRAIMDISAHAIR